MLSFRKILPLAMTCVLGLSALAEKPGDKPKAGEKAKKKDEEKAKEKPAKEPKKMSFPIPEGHDSKGLRIPYMDGEGKKTMYFVIGVARRTDADHVEMADLEIATFDEDGNEEMAIELPTSTLDLTTRVITTQKQVRIKRDDFELTGETMEFNTETKEGKLGGKVRMLIYNLASETGEKATAQSKDENKKSE
jgi:hypothetical protein